jgi:hypothetical protein
MIAGDNDTCDKFSPVSTTPVTIIAGDNDTGDNFFPGVIDTGQKCSKRLKLFTGVNDTAYKLSPLSMTPPIRQC